MGNPVWTVCHDAVRRPCQQRTSHHITSHHITSHHITSHRTTKNSGAAGGSDHGSSRRAADATQETQRHSESMNNGGCTADGNHRVRSGLSLPRRVLCSGMTYTFAFCGPHRAANRGLDNFYSQISRVCQQEHMTVGAAICCLLPRALLADLV